MSAQLAVKQSSLQLVESEISATLTSAINDFDLFVNQEANESLLEKLSASLQEISGIFRMLNLPVPAELCTAIDAGISKVFTRQREFTEKEQDALFTALYVLPRYYRYVTETGVTDPVVLSSYFYGLTAAGLVPLSHESHFAQFKLNGLKDEVITAEADLSEEALSSSVYRRLRHMYQLGLLGILGSKNVDQNKMLLLQRSISRCKSLTSGSQLGYVWSLFNLFFEAIESGRLEFTPQRRRFFTNFDRSLKKLEKNPAEAVKGLPDAVLLNELVYLVLLSEPSMNTLEEIQGFAEFEPILLTDQQIKSYRDGMQRAAPEALASMLRSVREELDKGKLILEAISESGSCTQEDGTALVDIYKTITDVLTVGGMLKEASIVRTEAEKMASWQVDMPDQEQLMMAANALLEVEGSLAGSRQARTNLEEGASAVSVGLFEQATLQAVKESKANIALAKRAIMSYVESNFDREHIANLYNGLVCVRGAFFMLEVPIAEMLVQKIADIIAVEYETPNIQSVESLETLADALVGVEYLLGEMEAGRYMDAQLKQVLEENLAALS